MRIDRILVLVRQGNGQRFNDLVDQQARSGWRDSFEVSEMSERKHAKMLGTISPSISTDHLLLRWENLEYTQILAESHLAFDVGTLASAGIKIRESTFETIFKEVNLELQRLKLHWKTHAHAEWEKSDIRFIHPEAWREQFAVLGYPWIGTALLKQLRVITAGELRSAFSNHPSETIGLRVSHAYFKDEEPGSSSIAIKDTLEHLYTNVIECDLEAERPFGNFEGDLLYLYEDGLWSGVELVKRLKCLRDICKEKYPHTQIHIRFGISSDAGLLAGRNCLTRERLPQIFLRPGKLGHLEFLKEGTEDLIETQELQDDEAFRALIDGMVEPYAFRDTCLWMGKSPEAKNLCTEIGKQLVRQWLDRTKPGADLEERSNKWALGASGFSSTIAFSKSIPKPVLPLFWLAGNVKIAGREVYWRPLFWDVRRTGPVPSQRRHKEVARTR